MKRLFTQRNELEQVKKNVKTYQQHLIDTYTKVGDGELGYDDFLMMVAERIREDLGYDR